jgi:CheY-like chemotaxis protein
VEDEEALRLATAKMLRVRGFGVVEAADGTEALAAIRAHKDTVAVVLLDLTLPGAPSHEVLAEARRVGRDTKVILTSAYGSNKLDEMLPQMEIDAFIRKPYQLAELVGMVQSILDQ